MKELLVYKNAKDDFKIKIAENGEQPYVYQVVSKYDADAPSGFKDHRTTKALDPDVNNTVPLAVYDDNRKVYDTGLTKDSKALKKLYPDEADRQRALQVITKSILNPLADLKGMDTLNPNNFEFWDDFGITISLDQSFNTSDPLQLYYLYILTLRGKLAPIGFESDPHYKTDAQYCVENKDSVIDVAQKREFEKSKATSRFMNLLDTDKEGLESILEWIGVPGVAGTEDALMNTIFTQWLQNDDNQNPKAFLEAYKTLYESPSGKNKTLIYSKLRKLEKARKVTRTPSGVSLGNDFLGKNMKDAAEKLVVDNELLQKFYDVFDAHEE